MYGKTEREREKRKFSMKRPGIKYNARRKRGKILFKNREGSLHALRGNKRIFI